jgi:hypothetical protein
MPKFIYFIVFAFILTACGTTSDTKNTNGSNGDDSSNMYEGVTGFILSLEGSRMLVIGTDGHQEATYYSFDESTEVEGEDGELLEIAAFRIGQYVKTYYEGAIAESYPMQGHAAKVVIFNGDEYPPIKGIAYALSTFNTEQDMPYIFSYEKNGEKWQLNFNSLHDDKRLATFKVNADGEIVE